MLKWFKNRRIEKDLIKFLSDNYMFLDFKSNFGFSELADLVVEFDGNKIILDYFSLAIFIKNKKQQIIRYELLTNWRIKYLYNKVIKYLKNKDKFENTDFTKDIKNKLKEFV